MKEAFTEETLFVSPPVPAVRHLEEAFEFEGRHTKATHFATKFSQWWLEQRPAAPEKHDLFTFHGTVLLVVGMVEPEISHGQALRFCQLMLVMLQGPQVLAG